MRRRRGSIRETHVYVLDFKSRARSVLHRSREGTIVTALGEKRFILLEMLANPGERFDAGERIEVDARIQAVMGRLGRTRISSRANQELPRAIQSIVTGCEDRFIKFLNMAGLVTAQVHSLSMLPGVGKALLRTILKERQKRPFENYADVEARTGWRDPAENLMQRIHDEMEGRAGARLFVRG